MIKTLNSSPLALRRDVERMVDEYGLRRLLGVVLSTWVARRRLRRARPPDATQLDRHLRRDVGLDYSMPETSSHYLDFALRSSR